jgi:type VI secretion system protein ImpH
VQLVLRKDDVPTTHLGQSGRMGFSTWMGHYPKPVDADQVVLTPVE